MPVNAIGNNSPIVSNSSRVPTQNTNTNLGNNSSNRTNYSSGQENYTISPSKAEIHGNLSANASNNSQQTLQSRTLRSIQEWIDNSPMDEKQDRQKVGKEIIDALNNKKENLVIQHNKITCFPNYIYAPNLQKLDASSNQLTSLDLNAPNLQTLDVRSNQLTSLDLNVPNLQKLYASDNQLNSLNLKAPNLQKLDVASNQLTSLDLNAPNLQTLYASDNQLTSLDLNAPNLQTLYASDNQLTSLDLNAPNLQTLYASDNQLTSLDLNAPNLQTLYASDNQLNSLDLNAPNLQTLYASDNQLTSLDLNAPNLQTLYVRSNQLTSLDLNAPNLQTLYASDNQLNSLNLNAPNLQKLDVTSNQLTSLNLNAPNLQILNARYNQLTSLDLNAPNLQTLDVTSNQLTSLNLNAPNLQKLDVTSNQLNSLPDSVLTFPENTNFTRSLYVQDNLLSTQEMQRVTEICCNDSSRLHVVLDDDAGVITKVIDCKQAILRWLLLDINYLHANEQDVRKLWCQTASHKTPASKEATAEKLTNSLVEDASINKSEKHTLSTVLSRLINIKQFLKLDKSVENIQAAKTTIQTIQRHLLQAADNLQYKNQMITTAKDCIGSCDDNIARFLLSMHLEDLHSDLTHKPSLEKLIHVLKTQFINLYVAKLTQEHMQKNIPYTDDVEVYMAYYLYAAAHIAHPPFNQMLFLSCANLTKQDLEEAKIKITNLCNNPEYAYQFVEYINFSSEYIRIINQFYPHALNTYNTSIEIIDKQQECLTLHQELQQAQNFMNKKITAKKNLWLALVDKSYSSS